MGVSEQAAYAATLVYRELSDRIDALHEELHALSTRTEKSLQALKAQSDGVSEPRRATPRPRSTGA